MGAVGMNGSYVFSINYRWLPGWRVCAGECSGERIRRHLYEIFITFLRGGADLMPRARLVELTEAVRSKLHVLNRFNYWKTFSYK